VSSHCLDIAAGRVHLHFFQLDTGRKQGHACCRRSNAPQPAGLSTVQRALAATRRTTASSLQLDKASSGPASAPAQDVQPAQSLHAAPPEPALQPSTQGPAGPGAGRLDRRDAEGILDWLRGGGGGGSGSGSGQRQQAPVVEHGGAGEDSDDEPPPVLPRKAVQYSIPKSAVAAAGRRAPRPGPAGAGGQTRAGMGAGAGDEARRDKGRSGSKNGGHV
jgi:hypothetical protein